MHWPGKNAWNDFTRWLNISLQPDSSTSFCFFFAFFFLFTQELSKITMPIVLNEPLSFLQRITEYMEHTYLINKASSLPDSIERMQVRHARTHTYSSANCHYSSWLYKWNKMVVLPSICHFFILQTTQNVCSSLQPHRLYRCAEWRHTSRSHSRRAKKFRLLTAFYKERTEAWMRELFLCKRCHNWFSFHRSYSSLRYYLNA